MVFFLFSILCFSHQLAENHQLLSLILRLSLSLSSGSQIDVEIFQKLVLTNQTNQLFGRTRIGYILTINEQYGILGEPGLSEEVKSSNNSPSMLNQAKKSELWFVINLPGKFEKIQIEFQSSAEVLSISKNLG